MVLFLEGQQEALLARLQHEMTDAADHFNFEAAARLRDRIVAVRRVTEGQKVVWRSRIDMDLIAVARAQGQACMQVFMVRGGKLIGQEHFILDGRPRANRRRALRRIPQAVLYRAHGRAPDDKTLSPARIARDNQSPVPEKRRPAATTPSAAAVPKELLVSALPDERA